MPASTNITLLSEAARTASGTGPGVDLGVGRTGARVRLTVVAMTSPRALRAVSLETAPDGASWRSVGGFQCPSVGLHAEAFAGLERYVRLVWTLDAGHTGTFGAAGQALVLYATPLDIERLSLPGVALEGVTPSARAEALAAATDDADAALAAVYELPLVAWPDSLRQRITDIAAFRLLRRRGFQPTGSDELVVKAYDDANEWLARVARGALVLPGVIDSSPASDVTTAVSISTSALRGW